MQRSENAHGLRLYHANVSSGMLDLNVSRELNMGGVQSQWIVVVLRKLADSDIPALLAGDFRNDILRIPFAPANGFQRLFVPAERDVSLLLVCRDSEGQLVPPPSFTLNEPPMGEAGPTAHRELTKPDPDFVFVKGHEPPDLHSLARGVAHTIRGHREPVFARPHQGSFGTRQRWNLTRIGWSSSSKPLVLVARSTFISVEDVKGWSSRPPDDARELEVDCDGLIDAETPEGQVTFYAVLERQQEWTPLTLSPVPPPFTALRKPVVLGNAEERLAVAFSELQVRLTTQPLEATNLPGVLDLWEATVKHLAVSTFRNEVLAWVRETRQNLLF